ncbi:SDR family NAD(P)-dependent oxidoreductase [Chitinimonas sp.]|uniref:SDR family NAD(P)-dependent oxidoreductase n=1 Tax=Chitinimonas sp. TaxID=1934313 RepID=UPI002F9234DA
MLNLQDKIVLITGGTSGIGLATAQAFLAQGAKVVITGRNVERGQVAEQSLRELGGEVHFHACDVSDPASMTALQAAIRARYGRLDCAVNNAAHSVQPGPLHEATLEEAHLNLGTDFFGVLHCLQGEIASMLATGGGTIVNVASVNGLSGTPNAAVYGAAKHAVVGLTRSAAKEYIARGIRINAVCPGPTDTPRRQRRLATLSPEQAAEQQAALAAAVPIGRAARAEEIANAILWLSSDASSYVVGHSLVVDGGLQA